MNRSDLKALQLENLKSIVDFVYQNNSYFRKKFEDAEVKPENIKVLKDIEKLPFLNKNDLRNNYPFGMLAKPKEELIRVHASSGTKGKPTIAAYTEYDINTWAEMIARAIGSAGGVSGDIVHNAYGYGLFTGGLGVHYGIEKFGAISLPVSTGNTKRQILMIQDLEPKIICSTPSYALYLAEIMESQGVDPKQTSLTYGIFGAETWTEEMRETIEERLNIKAVDIYGLSEVYGPGVSIECVESQNGLHIQEDYFYAEVIDPDTLEVLPEGEYGELVLTGLTKEATPAIRYRTGDIVSLNRDKCECGRTTVRMSRAKGRIDDMLIIKGVNVFPSEVERSLLQVEEVTPNYRLHLTKQGPTDCVTLAVEISEEFSSTTEKTTLEQIKQKIKKTIQRECLINLDVNLIDPKTLPRTEGKAVRVIDDRNKVTH